MWREILIMLLIVWEIVNILLYCDNYKTVQSDEFFNKIVNIWGDYKRVIFVFDLLVNTFL